MTSNYLPPQVLLELLGSAAAVEAMHASLRMPETGTWGEWARRRAGGALSYVTG